jgi:hypothetical protein
MGRSLSYWQRRKIGNAAGGGVWLIHVSSKNMKTNLLIALIVLFLFGCVSQHITRSAHMNISSPGMTTIDWMDASIPRKRGKCNEISICLKGDDSKELFHSKRPIQASEMRVTPVNKRNEILLKKDIHVFAASSSGRRYRIDNCNVSIEDTNIAIIHIDTIERRVVATATLCPKENGNTQLIIENAKVRFLARLEVSDSLVKITNTYFSNRIDTVIN